MKIFFKNIFFILLPINGCLFPDDLHAQWNKVGSANYVNPVYSLRNINNELYVGGDYSPFPSPSYFNIAKWNGTTWFPIDSAKYGNVRCFLEYNSELYIGGNFGTIDSINARGVAKWNGTQWIALGLGIPGGANYINSLAVFNGDVYAAGHFNKIGNVNTYGIGKWDGSAWSDVSGGLLGGFPAPDGQALLYKNELYVGGDFTMAGNVPANNIAQWNGIKWDSVSEGVPGEVLAFVVDTINDFLYAGGRFDKIGRWDGFAWKYLDSGIIGSTYSLAIYHNELYAVGLLWITGGEGVARWNGIYWEAVGGGTTAGGNTVFTCEVYKDELYVGGGFTDAGGNPTIQYIARWYSPPDTSCNFLQPVIYGYPPGNPKAFSDTFYYTDSVAVEFYNNIKNATYQWNFGDGDTGIGQTSIHYYNSAGSYTVSVIVNYPYGINGPCIDTIYKTITVINNTDVHEIKSAIPDFKVFPNPSGEDITIQLKNISIVKSAILTIHNSTGQDVLKQTFKKQVSINTYTWKKGVYFIEVCFQPNRCRTEKVMIE